MTAKIMTLTVILTLCVISSAGQQSQLKAPGIAPQKDIRQVDFKNFDYANFHDERKTKSLNLRNGKYVAGNGAECFLMRTTYGDLTGDAIEDAVLLLRGQNTNMSRYFDEVYVYTLRRNGKVMLAAHFEGGRRGDYILSIESLGSNFRVEHRLLILDRAVLAPGDQLAPTRYFTVKYRWNGVQLIETFRSALKPLPEHMREAG